MENPVYLTDKINIHPDEQAKEKLWHVSYACKDVWNQLNEIKRDQGGGYTKLKKMLPAMKHENEALKTPSSQTIQEVVKSLSWAWNSFFGHKKNGNDKANPPKFKSYKYFFTQKYPQVVNSFEIKGHTLRLAYGKSQKDWIEISLPSRDYDFGAVKTVTISYDKVQKKWYASITRNVEVPDKQTNGHTIYFDPGCKTSLTGIKTDRSVWEYDMGPLRELNMKHYRLIDRLKSLRDRKVKGSKRWRRLSAKITRIYRKMETQTKHYLHKTANKILADHPDVDTFMVGDWDKRQTLADTGFPFVDKRINRQVQNNNPLRKLIGYLKYKAHLSGREVEIFDERGTTRTCSKCDHTIAKGVSPSVRTFLCPKCGFSIARDINSTLNFLKQFQYALWQGLQGDFHLVSIVRTVFNPSSGKNRTPCSTEIILNYQDARCL